MPKRVYGSGSIVERRTKAGTVTLYGRWRRPNGVKVKVRHGVKRSPSYADGLTKAQAEAALRSAMEEDRKQQAARPIVARRGRSLGETSTAWLRHLEAKGAAPTYLEDTVSALKHHVLPFFDEDSELDTVDRDRSKDFRDHLLTVESKRTGRPLAAKTIRNYLTVLSSLLSFAQQEGWIVANPALGLSIVPKDGNGMLSSDQVMWPDDIARLIDAACEGPYRLVDRALYAVAAMSGLRKGECLGLRWRDVDFKGGRIRVRTQLARGDLERAPKSGEGRPVPMAGAVAAALLDLCDASTWTRPDDFVFADPTTGRRLAWTPTRRRYLRALENAGLERFSRFHDLRHSFASALAKAGRLERQIQEWCSHSSPNCDAALHAQLRAGTGGGRRSVPWLGEGRRSVPWLGEDLHGPVVMAGFAEWLRPTGIPASHCPH
jgi:integrase